MDWWSKWWCGTPCLRWMGCCAAPGALTTADHYCVVGWRGRVRTLVRWCRLLCDRAPCCAGSVPGRRSPAHICAQSLSMLWVCGMDQGWAILQVEHPPDEASWRNPNVYYDACGPPSPSRTHAGSSYGSDRFHCLSPNETHVPVSLHDQHNNVVGFMPSGFPERMVGHGWVPMTTEIRAVWPQVVPKLVKGEIRVYKWTLRRRKVSLETRIETPPLR
jgi:hypothetical protein